jgi:cellulose synthase/poly-beta-1,6-N-acetylglucosamine synthase-like glycosyltransferase
MPTWKALWRQRYRWMRGAIENLTSYGFTSVTRKYWLQQASLFVGAIALGLYWMYFVLILALGQLAASWWLLLMIVFIAERVYTVRRAGWRGMSVAAVIYPEIAYDMVILATFIWAAVGAVLRRNQDWHHLVGALDATASGSPSLTPHGAN